MEIKNINLKLTKKKEEIFLFNSSDLRYSVFLALTNSLTHPVINIKSKQ